MRLKFTLAYDGAHFRGWQSQPGGGSVQDVVQEALTRIGGGRKISLHGSGRTDAGVHALGQVAHADVPDGRSAAQFWLPALNAVLPAQVRVLSCARTADDFHARFSASGKVYEYLLWVAPVLPPHWAGRCWHVKPPPDPALLRLAARLFTGKHDFRGFSANRGTPVADASRTIRRASVRCEGPMIRLRFEGEGFLYKMVRMLVAAMVRVAQDRSSVDDLRARLAGQESALRREVAPPDGLYLAAVRYPRRPQSG